MTSLLFLLGTLAFAHKHHPHTGVESPVKPNNEKAVAVVQLDYQQTALPIFSAKCMDCHSQSPSYPWYHSLPVVKGVIDRDVAEANRHLDMTPGFPFSGHGDPLSDVEEIGSSLADGSMPPWRYTLMHPSKQLTPAEKQVVMGWVARSVAALKRP